jgi:glucose-1-phosphate adenylyltransferase
MDVRQMIDFHRSRAAGVTVSALAVPLESARSFGVLKTGADGRVVDFYEKPKEPCAIPGDPGHAYASMGNYVFDPEVLERVLREARERGEVDFGRDVLPRACGSERVYAYDFGENRVPGLQDCEERCYWRDVGTLSALAAAQQDAMGTRARFNLWNSRWPIHGEYEAAMLAYAHIRGTEEALKAPAPWHAPHRDRHTDERIQPS